MVVVKIKKYKYRRPKRPAICGPVNNIAILKLANEKQAFWTRFKYKPLERIIVAPYI